MVTTATERVANIVNAFSMRVLTTGLVVACTALMGVMYFFEVSIYQAAHVGCAKVRAIQDNATMESATAIPANPVSTAAAKIANGSEPAIDFVPKHVIYPPSVFASSLAKPIALDDALHHATLHVACMNHTESIIQWEFARNKNMSMANVINRDDPDLFHKIRQCPDVDIFHPGGLRGHGYCEDSVAYLKYLESRLLPQWVLEDEFKDPLTERKYRYYELCPRTPVIMFNHYWFHDRGDWPKTKKLYVMPNIEMGQLKAAEYWSVDAVLCKTAICARRVAKWFKQHGNPRNARVFYTRHSSADIATLAKSQSGEAVVNDFSKVSFAHASGSSPFKGTDKVFDCWMSRPDLPPLKIVIDRGRYERAFKKQWDKQVQESNGRIQVHLDGMDAYQYGTLLAATSFFLCPSTMEGYGHYLNQVRAAGALIVTTDLAPMNEFLSPESAVMVPVKRRRDEGMIMSGGFKGEHGLREDDGGLIGDFSGDDLCNAVDRVMKLTVAERKAKAARARIQYDIDTRFFAARMRELRTFAIVEGGRSDDF